MDASRWRGLGGRFSEQTSKAVFVVVFLVAGGILWWWCTFGRPAALTLIVANPLIESVELVIDGEVEAEIAPLRAISRSIAPGTYELTTVGGPEGTVTINVDIPRHDRNTANEFFFFLDAGGGGNYAVVTMGYSRSGSYAVHQTAVRPINERFSALGHDLTETRVDMPFPETMSSRAPFDSRTQICSVRWGDSHGCPDPTE